MYYLLDKKSDQTLSINFIGTEQFNVGDKLTLYMSEPIKGITSLTSYTDTVNGETDSVYLKKLIHQGQHELETVSFIAHESLSGIRTVQTYGMEEHQIKAFQYASKKLEKMAQKNYFIRASQIKKPVF